ncbi:mitochondrial nicotinamide adenine dinucleotide transporter SLC25A51 isoform X2 [Condylostylus longicornis]|uniref:mitochondrial nicotinamide adenine dinucleotide transporter SLC25A51 isoform X2 n=1 Tax=Condylostylus longicornis TaxID=2530218 RepID=UPI00244E067F|nr:mitochondrial nicotinamide adenine dinucleotide transporter SLC25A51 isoform X2 [Condylostylus longicornis]
MFLYQYFKKFDWREFVCGYGAATINIGVTYPIYKMIFRQMLHGDKVTSAFIQMKHEGLRYLYRGMLPPLAQKTISLSLMFGIYDGIKKNLQVEFELDPYTSKILAANLAGTCEAILIPFERVQTLLADSKYHKYFSNTPTAFRYVWTNHGFMEMYRGVAPILLRNGPSNAVFFVLREEASEHLPKTDNIAKKAAQEFFAGAVIGATVSTIFYPLNVIKVAMQSEMGHKTQGDADQIQLGLLLAGV